MSSLVPKPSAVAMAARRVKHEVHGVVVAAGLTEKTVKIRVGRQIWNKDVNKFFSKPVEFLVHDANSSVRVGDVISVAPGWRTSKNKRHYVKEIIAPFGTDINARPPVASLEELIARYEEARAKKAERREQGTEQSKGQKKGEKKEQEDELS